MLLFFLLWTQTKPRHPIFGNGWLIPERKPCRQTQRCRCRSAQSPAMLATVGSLENVLVFSFLNIFCSCMCKRRMKNVQETFNVIYQKSNADPKPKWKMVPVHQAMVKRHICHGVSHASHQSSKDGRQDDCIIRSDHPKITHIFIYTNSPKALSPGKYAAKILASAMLWKQCVTSLFARNHSRIPASISKRVGSL